MISGCQSSCWMHRGTSCDDPPRFASLQVGSVNAPRPTDRDALALPLMQSCQAATSQASDTRSPAASQSDAQPAHCHRRALLCTTREHARDCRTLRIWFDSSALRRQALHRPRCVALPAAFQQQQPFVHRAQCHREQRPADAGAECQPRPACRVPSACGRRHPPLQRWPRSWPAPSAATASPL